MEKYPIAERFLSIQGEGLHSGRRAYFVRLFGCNVRCPWCDTKYAWLEARGEIAHESAAEIAAAAAASRAEIAVITGGEPCLRDLRPLLAELSARGLGRHLETSGTLPILESAGAEFSWVALSPKLLARPLPENLARADELKMIVGDASELPLYAEIAAGAANAKCLWLAPEFSRSGDAALLSAIVDFVAENGGRYRAGWQVHKNYFAR